MTKHLGACQRRASEARAEAAGRNTGRKTKKFHLVVEGRGLPMYWMHLEVSTGVTLADLDQFLRETWLECCGHLSAFEIGRQRYLSHAGMYLDGSQTNKVCACGSTKCSVLGSSFFTSMISAPPRS